jgi:hypothetical protein
MSEQQIPEIPQSEPGPDTEPSPKPTKKRTPARGFNIVRVEKRVTATFSIMAKVFVIVLISIAAIFIARELSDDGYVISQINVPASFEDIGYTGPVVAKRISENLNRIIDITRTEAIAQGYTDGNSQADVSVDMVGLGVPVRGAIELIGNALGINRKKKISADITIEGSALVLVISITGETPERIEVPMEANVGVPLKKMVADASETILKYTNDRVLSLYYANYLRDAEKEIKHAKYLLEKYKGNAVQEARAYAGWAFGLLRQNKLDAAEQKVKQGLAINPNYSSLYEAWASIFQSKGDFANAIGMDKKAYALLQPDAPRFVRAVRLTNIGVGFAYNGQSDSAIHYYRKALEWDEKFNGTYYNLACEYSIRGDTTRCLDEVEKALAYGYNPKLIPEDPDMAGLLTHPRMKEMMLKYGEE